MIQIDMEMPKGCGECPMRDESYGFCALMGVYVYEDSLLRADECPLREVDDEERST